MANILMWVLVGGIVLAGGFLFLTPQGQNMMSGLLGKTGGNKLYSGREVEQWLRDYGGQVAGSKELQKALKTKKEYMEAYPDYESYYE